MKTTKLLAIILLICLALTFVSCNTPDNKPSTPDNNDSTPGADGAVPGTEPSTPGKDDKGQIAPINVIMINDNHGVLNEEDGSLDKIATGISYYSSLGEVVKIANGDMFQGTYLSSTLKGLPMLDALNALDFDAFVLGNHEFDWGLDEMKKYKDGDLSNGEAEFPFLGANIYDRSTNEMVEWLEPYAIVECDEIKIGIIGIIGEVESSILSSNVEDYDFVDARDVVKELAHELRTVKDCDVVIVASHGDDYSLNTTLAEYDGTSKIDGIFTGHTHRATDQEIERADGSSVCVLQNGGYGESFATLTLEFDGNGELEDTDGKLNYTDSFKSTGILAGVFEKYEEHLATGEKVLLTLDESVDRYEVGLTVARSMYVKYNTDFAVINAGGVRTSLDAGEVTYAEVFQILPFENEVYIVTLNGELLKSYLYNSGSIYYWGIDVNSIEDSKEYRLAIVDFVYLGDSFEYYRNDSCIDTDDLIRDVFIELLQSLG